MFRDKCICCIVVLALLSSIPLVFLASAATAEERKTAGDEFCDLSEKEHCLTNLALSYAERDLEKFSDLLHEDYRYYLGTENEEQIDAQKELEMTSALFKRAVTLSYEIEPGTWTQIDELLGSPCGDCWESTRKYTISSQVSEDREPLSGSGYVKFIVTRVEVDGKSKYKILAAFDLGREQPE